MYERLGHIYEPVYRSFFCDTELTDRCNSDLRFKTKYIPQCIIRHKHPFWTKQPADALYHQNQRFWTEDFRTYVDRKKHEYDFSILIATLDQRRILFDKLTTELREKFARICPGMRLEILEERDSGQISVGLKRRKLLQRAKGKYTAFIDDDDAVTDEYFEDFLKCFIEKKDMMRIRGKMHDYTFTNSLATELDSKMYVDGVFIRLPNHINPMLAEIARMVTFEDAVRAEDLKWTIDLSKTGLLKSESTSDPSRIHYLYNLGDRPITAEFIDSQQQHTLQEWVTTLLIRQQTPSQPQRRGVMRLGARGFVSR
jgi:hypothetical protein